MRLFQRTDDFRLLRREREMASPVDDEQALLRSWEFVERGLDERRGRKEIVPTRSLSLAKGTVFSQNLPMLRRSWVPPIVLIALLGCARVAATQSPAAITGPAEHVFASPGGTDLRAYVFAPEGTEVDRKRAGIVIYEGFGHLFTPAGIPDTGQPRPDPATRADALAKAERFLKSLGYLR
jgi:hypothetical protein